MTARDSVEDEIAQLVAAHNRRQRVARTLAAILIVGGACLWIWLAVRLIGG